jgi:hypothetical protein
MDGDSPKRGNDVAIFGREIKDLRLQIAFKAGWYIEVNEYQGVDYYILLPPNHFECTRWASIGKTETYEDIAICFLSYYYEDKDPYLF